MDRGRLLRRTRRSLCVLLALPLLSLHPGKTSPPGRIAPGPLEIQVVSAKDGRPLGGIGVRLGGRFAATNLEGRALFLGLPRGKWRLTIHQAGWNRLEKDLVLPAGGRKPVKIALRPVVLASFTGRVMEEGFPRPVAGAELTLEPLQVGAALQGASRFYSDWKGAFQVRRFPAGTYRLQVRAPGFETWRGEVSLRPGSPPIQVRVKAGTRTRSLTVKALDALTRRPIEGAQVTLSEAWPQGILAAGTTGPGGRASFRNLSLGPTAFSDRAGRIRTSGKPLQVLVEAPGYARGVTVFRPGGPAEVLVHLHPEREIREKEPNDQVSTAQEIPPGTRILLSFDRKGDKDIFRFHLEYAAKVTSTLGPLPVFTEVSLTDASGRNLFSSWDYPGKTIRYEGFLPPGTYFFSAGPKENAKPSRALIPLEVERVLLPDLNEPNGAGTGGGRILPGRVYRGYLAFPGDEDLFRFHLDRPSTVRFRCPGLPLLADLAILDETGRRLAFLWEYPGKSVVLRKSLPGPAWYTFQVRSHDGTKSSIDPYEFSFLVIPDIDPAGTFPASGGDTIIRNLEPGTLVSRCIPFPGKRDLYLLSPPFPGTLFVEIVGPSLMNGAFLDRDGKVLLSQWEYPGRPLRLTLPRPRGKPARLRVACHNGADWNPSPYTLRAWFSRAGEEEEGARNEDLSTAVPADLLEPITGSFEPLGDKDFFSFTLQRPGRITFLGKAPSIFDLALLDERGRKIRDIWEYPGRWAKISAFLAPGLYYLLVQPHGIPRNPGQYVVRPRFLRAEPGETLPLRSGPTRRLVLEEGRTFVVDSQGDLDGFDFSLPAKGVYFLHSSFPVLADLRLSDSASGKTLRKDWFYPGYRCDKIEASGATRYRLEAGSHGSAWSETPGFFLVSASPEKPSFEVVSAEADPFRPVKVRFDRKALRHFPRASKVEVDPMGGRDFKLSLPLSGAVWTYPEEGIYRASARITGPSGRSILTTFWVRAQGPKERKGVQVRISGPMPGETIQGPRPCLVQAYSYEAPSIRSVSVFLDGRPAGRAYRPPFSIPVSWTDFGPGGHTLSVTAVDTRGNRKTVSRKIRVSEFFDLTPADGSAVSGNAVRIRWIAGTFGPSKVRYRPAGGGPWKTVLGESGRVRTVLLRDLEPGKEYLFQPLGENGPGPERRVTRIRGLAFGKQLYGGTIARDYDQRISVTVRNQGDKPLQVRLAAELPRNSRLLAAFTGEGAEGRPCLLGPGEEKAFVLGLSAQDVVRPVHRFPIRVTSQEGMTDQAEVEVHVRLPRVKLTWKKKEKNGATPSLEGTFVLENHGDTLTDLAVFPASPGVEIFPRIEHGMLRAGRSMTFSVRPRMREGFRSVRTEIVARSLDKEVRIPFEASLPEGESMQRVLLLPGGGLDRPGRTEEEDLRLARTVAAAWLDPSIVDWRKKEFPQDTDRDGRPDRWEVKDTLDRITWTGDDTDGDGRVDFVQADLGMDGTPDGSWLLDGGKWRRTNLVDAWLEMRFSLPKDRSRYEKHDLDLVLNGKVVGSLRQTLPEGNYSFRLPPSLLSWKGTGEPGDNTLEIRSRFMNFAHYIITSDFQVKCRLRGIQAWVAGKDGKDAAERLFGSNPEIMAGGPDFSIASADLSMRGPTPLKKGALVEITGLLRNLGGPYRGLVPVALVRSVPGGKGVELARTFVRAPSLDGTASFSFHWKAAAGRHSLKVTADPDGEKGDRDSRNNTGVLNVLVPGDDSPPKLEVLEPADHFRLAGTIVDLAALAEDDGGVERVEVRVDRGVFTPLHRQGERFEGKALLQPGSHVLTFRALDGGGNRAVRKIRVQVEGKPPAMKILVPRPGTEVSTRFVEVELQVGKEVEAAAVRVEGGPWWELEIRNGRARGKVALPFGRCRLEALAVDGMGRWRMGTSTIHCSAQRKPGETLAEPTDKGPRKLPGLPGLLLDPLAGPNRVLGAREDPSTGDLPGEREAKEDTGRAQGAFRPGSRDRKARPASFRGSPTGGRGMVTVRRSHRDWYCPNRPRIRTRFRLPGYLAEIDFSRFKPGSKAYRELEKRLLDRLRRRGIDTSRLEKFRDLLLRWCGRLRQGGPLPDFWQSLGFKALPPEDPAALEAWRERMREHTSMFWLRLLASGDPALIAQGLRARAEAMKGFDEALSLQAQAVIETVEASQQLAEDVVESGLGVAGVFFPPAAAAGELIDAYTALSGKGLLSGRQVGVLERFLRGAGSIGARGLQAAWSRSPAFRKAAQGLYRFTASGGEAAKDFFRRLFPKTTDLAERGIRATTKCLAKERKLDFWRKTRRVEEAGEIFRAGAEGTEAAKRLAKDEGRARALLEEFKKADDPETLRKLVRKGQSDKTFQRVVNREADDAIKRKFNETIRKIYRDADHVAGARLKQVLVRGDGADLDRIAAGLGLDPRTLKKAGDKLRAKVASRKEALRKMGLEVDQVTVEPLFVTRPRKNLKVGRDRDVTFFVYGRTKDGKKVILAEVDHALSGPVYKQEFWKSAMGTKDVPRLPDGRPDMKAVEGFAENLDQAVTSSRDLEAYNLGEVGLEDFFKQDGPPPAITRLEDVKDTIYFKSDHWFKKAAARKDPLLRGRDLVEGMRQSHKQFDDMVIPRIRQYGLDPAVDVPPKLQVGMDIFKQASAGKITPEEALVRLKALGETPESMARKAADYLEGVEKTAGKAYRIAGTKELEESLARIRKNGAPGWAEESLKKAKDCLLTGKVSGTTFQRVRTKVFLEKYKELAGRPGGAELWRKWVRRSFEEGLLTLDEAGRLLSGKAP